MYTNWEKYSTLISSFEWYSVIDTIKHLQGIRSFIINTPDKLSSIYAPQLNPIELTNVSRFPDEGYLCEGIGDWHLKLDLLHLTLSTLYHHNKMTREYEDFKTIGQAEKYCMILIHDLLTSIYAMTEVVRQDTFETKYGLKWDQAHHKDSEEPIT
ncbi:hypothetical protein BDB01DRAFT_405937 [Pilobolus umbonatus]|nr:hypothetical protein BDB01DRAFT_405937 [Pilobolus umbonatus]